MVTTVDNKFNPFTNFEDWYRYDTDPAHPYCTSQWLDNFLKTSSLFDEETINSDVSDAIDDFLKLNPYGMHIKIFESDADKMIQLANEAYEQSKLNPTQSK